MDTDDWMRTAAGDGEAFGRIFDRHRGRVLRHAIVLASNPGDADDIVAIAFLEAWRKRDVVRLIEGSLLPWLLVTATNASRNMARSTRRYRALLARLPESPHAPDHADTVGLSETERVLATLPLADQQVITLCVLYDFSERDAAFTLGVAPGTVKSRLSRAKQRLRRSLPPLSTDHVTGGTP